MIIYTARKKTSTNWRPVELNWEQFVDKLRKPLRTGETMREYKAMEKKDKDVRKEMAGGFVAGELSCGRRKTEYVVNRCMITLDADFAKPGTWERVTPILEFTMACYSTHSYTVDKPRLRWVIPTDRPMTPDEYPAVSRMVASWIDLDSFDTSTHELARLMYWPTCAQDGVYEFHEQDGPLLSVDEVLAFYGPNDAWKDSTLWPIGKGEEEVPHTSGCGKTAEDPRRKAGIVGAFCRTYDIPEVIDTFLSEVYEEAGPGRYTYTGGSSYGGARLYDEGQHLYSSHATDPAGGQSCNAFDLVRIHKYGELDTMCNSDTPMVERPSYRAMVEWCKALPEVKERMEAEKRAEMTGQWSDLGNLAASDAFDAFGFYSVPELTEEDRRPPEFIIDGMIPVGMTFLSGAPKTRKSFLALQMAIAVASGQPFWEHKVTQCDVAYLDLEGSRSRIAVRTGQMTSEMPRNVYVTNTTDVRLADGLVERLRQLHRQRPAIRFIIIDTFSRARGLVKANGSNAYDSDVALLEPVQRMALEENIAVLFVHHDKKGASMMGDSFERLSGTMGISGSADCVINLITEGKRFGGKAKLECTPRDAKGFELNIAFADILMEWLPEKKPDLTNDPLCAWILGNVPDRGVEGKFWSYEDVFQSAYKSCAEDPGRQVRDAFSPHREELFTNHNVCVQLAVRSHGKRGLRIINVA